MVDPDNRELTISCGAALYYLKLAMNCDSLATLVRVLPPSDDEDLLARVMVVGPHVPSEDEKSLFDYIPKRRTNRFPFSKQGIDPDAQAEWIGDAKSEGAWLPLVHSDREKHTIADLVSEGDRRHVCPFVRCCWQRSRRHVRFAGCFSRAPTSG